MEAERTAPKLEQEAVTTFDDLFGSFFSGPKPGSVTEKLQPLSSDQKAPSGMHAVAQPADQLSVGLYELPAFGSLIKTASNKGFVSIQEVVAQLPKRHIESFIRYAIDHEIPVLESDPLTELAAEKPPAVDKQEQEQVVDLFSYYRKETWRYPLLTASEEVDLAEKMAGAKVAQWRLEHTEGDDESRARLEMSVRQGECAKRRFVEGNLRLVVHWAVKYQDQGLDLVDLVQEGNIGLLKAVERFNARIGCRFGTYASWWIKQSIRRAIEDQSRLIRLPVHMSEQVRRYQGVVDKLQEELLRPPTCEEVAVEMGWLGDQDDWLAEEEQKEEEESDPDYQKEVRRGLARARRLAVFAQEPLPFSMVIDTHVVCEDKCLELMFGADALAAAKESSCCLWDLLDELGPATLDGDPAQAVWVHSLEENLGKALATLLSREQRILEMRFGLNDGCELTLEEVGKKYGVTRERIRQIEAKALRKMRAPTRAYRLQRCLQDGGWRAVPPTPVPKERIEDGEEEGPELAPTNLDENV